MRPARELVAFNVALDEPPTHVRLELVAYDADAQRNRAGRVMLTRDQAERMCLQLAEAAAYLPDEAEPDEAPELVWSEDKEP